MRGSSTPGPAAACRLPEQLLSLGGMGRSPSPSQDPGRMCSPRQLPPYRARSASPSPLTKRPLRRLGGCLLPMRPPEPHEGAAGPQGPGQSRTHCCVTGGQSVPGSHQGGECGRAPGSAWALRLHHAPRASPSLLARAARHGVGRTLTQRRGARSGPQSLAPPRATPPGPSSALDSDPGPRGSAQMSPPQRGLPGPPAPKVTLALEQQPCILGFVCLVPMLGRRPPVGLALP